MKLSFDRNLTAREASSCLHHVPSSKIPNREAEAINSIRSLGRAFISDCSEEYTTDESQLEVEPTPINTEPGKVRLVAEIDPVCIWTQDLSRDVIDVLLHQPGSTHSPKERDPCDEDSTSRRSIPQEPLSRFIESTTDTTSTLPSPCTEAEVQYQTKEGFRFRAHQSEQWWTRLNDMNSFRSTHGHCCVPHAYPHNPNLAQWVKRQRYQYKLKQEGKHSTLTDEREEILERMGFIWDSHGASWMERWNQLAAFRQKNGHSNVPTKYPENRHLAIWVKCQRRQYRLLSSGRKSNLTPERLRKLKAIDFVWNPRGAK